MIAAAQDALWLILVVCCRFMFRLYSSSAP
jgi:hypothetical protein